MKDAKLGFEMRKLRLPLDSLLPVRQVKDPQFSGTRYQAILASIKEVGLVEPLTVHPVRDVAGKYLLLDGHFRLAALKELGKTQADCIVSIDDESFTYNARVNWLNPIQAHKMILKAVQNGVRPERIAAALNIQVSKVQASLSLLDGIHAEAADLLKDKAISPKAIRLLKRVTGVRQIEIAELMMTANNYSSSYAEALFLGTPKDQLTNPTETKQKEGLTAEDIARMEREMESLEHDLKAVEGTYGENNLNLTFARGYIRKLLGNTQVVRFLKAHHAEILAEFETLVVAETL